MIRTSMIQKGYEIALSTKVLLEVELAENSELTEEERKSLTWAIGDITEQVVVGEMELAKRAAESKAP